MSAAVGTQVVTEALGGSVLSRAIQDGRLPPGLQPRRPSSGQEWSDHVARVRDGANAGWFTALEGAIAPAGAAARRLSRVVDARGVLVTTGQQPGLFGGPVYTIAKALTALALADAIEERASRRHPCSGRSRTTPTFWRRAWRIWRMGPGGCKSSG